MSTTTTAVKMSTTTTAVPDKKIGASTRPIVLDDHLANVPPESNSYKRQKEKIEFDHAKRADYQTLLPTLDDSSFQTKIVQHAAFHSPVGTAKKKSAQEESDEVCGGNDDDDNDNRLLPHQLFIRNFLKPTSPYNSLLLYHNASTAYHCAAIGVAEEWRRQDGKIGIWTDDAAAFRRALFHPDMLETIGDRVVAKSGCASDSLLRDANPLNAGLPLDQIVKDIEALMAASYFFNEEVDMDQVDLVIIDNMHPLPPSVDNQKMHKLLLLYSEPMLTRPQEIIPLVNLMNANDHRGLVEAAEIFDSKTNEFVKEHKENGHYVQEGGRDLLHRKLNGYVSYLRSDTPIPVRLYPDDFAPDHAFRAPANLMQSLTRTVTSLFSSATPGVKYPRLQINGSPLKASQQPHLPLYVTALGEEQEKVYKTLAGNVNSGDSLRPLLDALTMTYPAPPLMDSGMVPSFDTLMKKRDQDGLYEYRYPAERIFASDRLAKHGGKLAAICQIVKNSTGRILIVSRETSLLPMALALEEHNLVTRQLFNKEEGNTDKRSYTLNDDNMDTADIVLVTTTHRRRRLHNIRQIHFLDTLPAMVEQTIAMAAFPRSHCGLPFAQRNIEIYMHVSIDEEDKELADLYGYRRFWEEAAQVGRVTRLIKEVAVDCLFAPRMGDAQEKVEMELSSSKKTVTLSVADRPYSAMCDYMQTNNETSLSPSPVNYKDGHDSNSPPEAQLTRRIRQLFQEKVVYTRAELLESLQRPRLYPLEKILVELARLVDTKSDVLFDKYGRRGYLVKTLQKTFAFQPVEITDTHIDERERKTPVDVKPSVVTFVEKDANLLGKEEPLANPLGKEEPSANLLGKEEPSANPLEEKPRLGGNGGIIASIQLCEAVATGDCEAQLPDPWYKTVRAWFNELQLIHKMTANEIRQIVVDRAIDVLSHKDRMAIEIMEMRGKHPTERRVGISLERPPTKEWIIDGKGQFFLQSRPKTPLASVPKQDLLILVGNVLPPATFHPKRRVRSPELAVLAEVLLRHRGTKR